jgi:hypothetical protein
VLDYARTQLVDVISKTDFEQAKEIRQDRSLAEYGDFPSRQLDADHVRAASEVAERFVSASPSRSRGKHLRLARASDETYFRSL